MEAKTTDPASRIRNASPLRGGSFEIKLRVTDRGSARTLSPPSPTKCPAMTQPWPWVRFGCQGRKEGELPAIQNAPATLRTRLRAYQRRAVSLPSCCPPQECRTKHRLPMPHALPLRGSGGYDRLGPVGTNCFPSGRKGFRPTLCEYHKDRRRRHEVIADVAGCARSTVYEAIRALERVRVLTWQNRLVRVRGACADLFGKKSGTRWRVVRSSNAYAFTDPASIKSETQTGTTVQGSNKKEKCGQLPRSHQHERCCERCTK
jgi:hypothetical protein